MPNNVRPTPPGDRARPRCNVCGAVPVAAVAVSTFGAISFAYCHDCLHAGAEPWGMVVQALAMAGEQPTPRMQQTAMATCKRLGRSMEQMQQAVDAVLRAWEEEGEPYGNS